MTNQNMTNQNMKELKQRLKTQLDSEARNWAKRTLGNGPLANTPGAYLNRMRGSGIETDPRVGYVSNENIKLLYNTRHLPNHKRLLELVIKRADANIWNHSNNY
jgi:hypothetical protein